MLTPSAIRTEWTYDSFGRIQTKTNDPTRGYILTFDYDNLDSLTINMMIGQFDQVDMDQEKRIKRLEGFY